MGLFGTKYKKEEVDKCVFYILNFIMGYKLVEKDFGNIEIRFLKDSLTYRMYCIGEICYDNFEIRLLYEYCNNVQDHLFKNFYKSLIDKAGLTTDQEYALFDYDCELKRMMQGARTTMNNKFELLTRNSYSDRSSAFRDAGAKLTRELYFCTSGTEILQIVKTLKRILSKFPEIGFTLVENFRHGEYRIFINGLTGKWDSTYINHITTSIGGTPPPSTKSEDKGEKSMSININDFKISHGILEKYLGNSNDITVPNGVTVIKSIAFYDCKSIRSITMPRGLTEIENQAFEDCTNLQYVFLPNTLKTIGWTAFTRTAINTIEIPNGVTSIEGAFICCPNLASVTLHPGITNIDEAFRDCPQLRRITVPTGITSLNSSFSGCSNLTIVILPDSVTCIGYSAFYKCSGLTSISLPKHVINIEAHAFAYSGLLSIELPDGIKKIGESAFFSCKQLKTITIPQSVSEIGESAFGCCTALQKIIFKGSQAQWNNIVKGNKWDSVYHDYTIEYLNETPASTPKAPTPKPATPSPKPDTTVKQTKESETSDSFDDIMGILRSRSPRTAEDTPSTPAGKPVAQQSSVSDKISNLKQSVNAVEHDYFVLAEEVFDLFQTIGALGGEKVSTYFEIGYTGKARIVRGCTVFSEHAILKTICDRAQNNDQNSVKSMYDLFFLPHKDKWPHLSHFQSFSAFEKLLKNPSYESDYFNSVYSTISERTLTALKITICTFDTKDAANSFLKKLCDHFTKQGFLAEFNQKIPEVRVYPKK